jgi:hypothetical protein
MREIGSKNRLIYVVRSDKLRELPTNRTVTTPHTFNKMLIVLQSTEGKRLKAKSAV